MLLFLYYSFSCHFITFVYLFTECDDVANVTLFLLSDYSTYVNGVSIPVDGGFLAS